MRSAEGEATDGGAPMVELLDGIYKGDKVYVLMDGDLMTKHDIRRAAGTLARAIWHAKATPVFPVLPFDAHDRRMGADDWIMSFDPSQRTPEHLIAALAVLPIENWRDLPESARSMIKRLDLMVDGKGNPFRNDENTRKIMVDVFGVEALFYDQYKGPMFMAEGKAPVAYTDDTLDSELYRYIERTFGTWSKECFRSVRRAMISQTKRNLLGEHIASIQWDGIPRIDTLLVTHFDAEDTPYNRKVSRGVCLGSISRLMEPG